MNYILVRLCANMTQLNTLSGPAYKPLTQYSSMFIVFNHILLAQLCFGHPHSDSLRGLVVRVPGYRSSGLGSILGVTRFSEK
jgi:hypothetical protein